MGRLAVIHIGFLTGYRNRIGAVFSWWFAFTRDLRRNRTYTIDDMPIRAFSEQAAADGRPAVQPADTHDG